MAFTRKQIVTCVSIVYLIIATALSGYAQSRSSKLSVPIPCSLSGFTTALPIIAGLLLEGGYDLTRRQERRRHAPRGDTVRPPLVILANTIIVIYSTVLITLLGTHAAPPSDLQCGLQERWQKLFQQKDTQAIRRIQDAFQCCGLMNSHDKAWPFPDRTHDARACEDAFGRTSGCFGPWRQEEQRLAGIMMVVVGMVYIWQCVIVVFPTKQSTFLHRVLPESVSRTLQDEEQGSSGARRAIDYLPANNRYRDEVTAEPSDSEEESTPRRVIEDTTNGAKDTLNGLNGQDHDQQPTVENEWSRH